MKPAHLAVGALSFLAVTGVAYQFHSYSDRSPVAKGVLRDALDNRGAVNSDSISFEKVNIKNLLNTTSNTSDILPGTSVDRRVGPGGQDPRNRTELIYVKLYVYCGGSYCRDQAEVARHVRTLESEFGMVETEVNNISGEGHAVYGRIPGEKFQTLKNWDYPGEMKWLGEARAWSFRNAVPAPISIRIFYSHVGGRLSLIGWNNPLPGHKEKVVDAALKELSKANFSYEKIGMDENFESTLVLQGRIAPDDLPALKLVVKNIQLPAFNQALPHVSFDIPYKE